MTENLNVNIVSNILKLQYVKIGHLLNSYYNKFGAAIPQSNCKLLPTEWPVSSLAQSAVQLEVKAGSFELQGDVFVSIASTGVLNPGGLELAG